MKRKILFLMALLPALMTVAQNEGTSQRTVHADDNHVVHKTGLWVRSHVYDNWYVNLQAGPALYGGLDDYQGPFFGQNPFKDGHLTWGAEAKIGRWVFPKLGYRFGIGTGYFHGFLTQDHFNATGATECGYGTAQDGYPGYFWETNDPELLIQRWRYLNVTGDMMIRFITTKNYEREQKWVPYMSLGVHFVGSLSGDGLKEHRDQFRYGSGIHGTIGLSCRINEHWSVYGEARAAMQSGTFDREWINGVESPGFNEDFPVYLHFGAEYRFNWRREAKRGIWMQQNDSTQGVMYARTDYGHQFDFDTFHLSDTVRFYENLFEFSPEYMDQINRRAQQIADSILFALSRNRPDATLRDIFNEELLPYEMVFFQLDKWNILPHEQLKVRKMAQLMKTLPDKTFLLIGSADAKTGTVKRNDFLSVNRADVVYNMLVYEYGIRPEQLQRVYLGGILDYEPFELNRATVIIMDHPKVLEEFYKLRDLHQAGGSEVKWNEKK